MMRAVVLSAMIPLTVLGVQPVLEKGGASGVTVRLTPDAPVADVSVVAAKLVERAEAAGESVESVDLRLEAANWMMAYELEPAATRLLLGIPHPDDATRAAGVVAAAAAQLARAESILDKLPSGAMSDGDRRLREEECEKLDAFATAFGSIWPDAPAKIEDREDALKEAAFALADVLEDDRREVAFGAQVWQAYLYGMSGREKRANDLLPAVMEPVKPEDGSFGLYARLLRCRFMAEGEGGCVAPVALLARLEEQCGEWYEDAALRDPARRTVALVRRQLLQSWAGRFREAGQADRAAWCDRMVKQLDDKYFDSDDAPAVLRLRQAVPSIVDLSDFDGQPKKGHNVALEDVDTSSAPTDVNSVGIE